MALGLSSLDYKSIIPMMDLESSAEQPETKNCKVIDGQFVVDLKGRIGGGSYSQVFAAWPKGKPGQLLACKVISKQ